VRTFAADTTRARRLSLRYLPESRLTQHLPFLDEALDDLQDGETSAVVPANGQFHVLRLDRRRSASTTPKLDWVVPQIRRHLQIRARKQMYANEVERLRSNARVRGILKPPDPPLAVACSSLFAHVPAPHASPFVC